MEEINFYSTVLLEEDCLLVSLENNRPRLKQDQSPIL